MVLDRNVCHVHKTGNHTYGTNKGLRAELHYIHGVQANRIRQLPKRVVRLSLQTYNRDQEACC